MGQSAGITDRKAGRVRVTLPNLEISLRVAERDDALSMLRGMLDLAVIEARMTSSSDGGLTFQPLLSDPCRIVVPAATAWPPGASSPSPAQPPSPGSISDARSAAAAPRPAPPSSRPDSPHRAVEADEYWPAQGFVAARPGPALIPALALGVLHDGVAVRRLHHANQPEPHVLAATRPAISGSAPVQAVITALQAEADTQRHHNTAGAPISSSQNRMIWASPRSVDTSP